MWFTKLIKQFFFWIDKIVYNFIPSVYDLLLTIARTSILSQSDISEMAERIYKLLAIFMIFKVTLSLITYVVNPDDFSDKSKGVSKLGTNIVISLALLILTPYIFNYAYQFQTIILEDNSLATLVFGEISEEDSFFNSAGEDISYITMSAFLTPNLAWDELYKCSNLIDPSTKKFNTECRTALEVQVEDNDNFKKVHLDNYVAGVENKNLGLMFRQDLVLATDKDNKEFIMDYKFIFSTVVGVVIILLLITFCMDIAVRSIKLSFLQLIAPIPILSYVDPKSGKDGLFKKWYEMCFTSYISLFVRLLALYFSVYIISKVADMKLVDIIDGSNQTGFFLSVFVIIGALMFAKQLPEILKGLGIKLDGGGKFTLNPLKKIEDGAIGGKQIKKAAGYAARPIKGVAMAAGVGARSLITGQGLRGMGKAFGGAMKGEKFGKNWSSSYAAAKARKKQIDQMDLDGVKPGQVRMEKFKNYFRGKNAQDEYKDFQDSVKVVQNGYEQYYKGVLGGDKVAKMLEQRRVAAENAGDYNSASRLQDAIDERVADIRKNHGVISLDVKNKAELEKFGEQVAEGKLTYKADFSTASQTMGLSKDQDKGLNSIESRIGKTIEHIDTHYDGRFDYKKEDLGKYKDNGDGTYSVENLKLTNGKSKAVVRASENSEEAKNINNIYKYMDSKK